MSTSVEILDRYPVEASPRRHLQLVPEIGRAATQTEVLPESPPTYEVAEDGEVTDDVLMLDIFSGYNLAARAELGFYDHGKAVDIEELVASGEDNKITPEIYETIVAHLANGGAVNWIRAFPADSTELMAQAKSRPPDGWQKAIQLRSEFYNGHGKTSELNSANLDLALEDLAKGREIAFVFIPKPKE